MIVVDDDPSGGMHCREILNVVEQPTKTPLRVLFVGRDNAFNRGIASWIENNFELVGCFFNEIGRFGLKGRLGIIRRKIKRYGAFRTVDQLALQVLSVVMRKVAREDRRWRMTVAAQFIDPVDLSAPCFEVDNVHSEKWVQKCKDLKPDVILGACGSVLYKKRFYSIPPLGTFIFHEGLTPEYKGLHTALWAIMQGEPEKIGVTILQIDDSIDGGDVLFQKRYILDEYEGLCSWSLVAHRAIITALPEIRLAFAQLQMEGSFDPVDTSGRETGLYTWMGLSRFVWLLFLKGHRPSPSRKP